MTSKVKLPISLVHKGTRFLLVHMLPKHVPEIETIVQQTVRVGSGMYMMTHKRFLHDRPFLMGTTGQQMIPPIKGQ